MSLVMDGVVRRGIVQMPVANNPKPNVAPMAAASLVSGGPRFVTGIDGIRRPVAPLSPRQMLANMQTANVEAEPPAAVLELPAVGLPDRTWTRPVAFGLVATAVVGSSVAAGWNLTHHTAALPSAAKAISRVAAQSNTKVAAAAPAPAATPDAAAAAAALAVKQQEAAMGQIVANFAKGQESQYGIVVKDLSTGATTTLGSDQSMTSASLYKLFVAQQIYRQIDAGQLTLGNQAGGGSGRTIDQCLTIMINISDNTCGRALGSILNWGAQDAALKADGYTGTSLVTPQQTSARDVAFLLERLYRGTLNSPSSNDRFMALLKDQRVNNRLPQGVPAGTVMAHKTGDLDGYMHDAGIVYGAKTNYLVVVMGKPGVTADRFATLSSQLWNYFEAN